MANEELILKRTIELLIVAGHVDEETVEKARQMAIKLSSKIMKLIPLDKQAAARKP